MKDGNGFLVQATSTSVGIAVAPEDGTEPDRLLKHADLADLAGHDHHLRLTLVRGAVGRHEREVELLAGSRH